VLPSRHPVGTAAFWVAMLYCTPEKCALCQLIPGSDFCLRRQARRCVAISRRVVSRSVRHTLVELGMQLMDEARAPERQSVRAGSD
jgi:hypothetical protein